MSWPDALSLIFLLCAAGAALAVWGLARSEKDTFVHKRCRRRDCPVCGAWEANSKEPRP